MGSSGEADGPSDVRVMATRNSRSGRDVSRSPLCALKGRAENYGISYVTPMTTTFPFAQNVVLSYFAAATNVALVLPSQS